MITQNTNKQIKVLVYPKASNPYQDLLYSHFPKNKKILIRYINGPTNLLTSIFHILITTYQLIQYRIKGYKILHIHWLYALSFPKHKMLFPVISETISTLQTLFFLRLIRILNFKIVWTAHDLLPHDKQTLNDLKITQKLINQSSKIILLSNSSFGDMDNLGLKYDKNKTFIIPLGNYIDVYPNFISKNNARKILGIPQNSFVFVYFGRIEPYKGVPVLLDAYIKISQNYSNTHLVIAGKVNHKEIKMSLLKAKKKLNKELFLYLDFIPDKEVQLFYNIADITVSPFLEITNSSSIMLSASFGKPIIAPLLGSLKEVPQNIGYFYKSNSSNTLYSAMKDAVEKKEKLKTKSDNAWKYAKSIAWNNIMKQTNNIYKKI